VLRLGMDRAQAALVDEELLRLARIEEADEEPRRVGVRRLLGDARAAADEGRALGGIEELDRRALGDLDEARVLVAVEHEGTLAEAQFLRRVVGGLDGHHLLLTELLEI